MIGLLVAGYFCGAGQISQVLGATTIRTESLDSALSTLPETSGLFPIDLTSAIKSAFGGNPSSQLPGSLAATTVTPQEAAWADIAGGSPARSPEVTAISGLGPAIGHPSPPCGPRKLNIHDASQKQSEHDSAYRISTLIGVIPSRAFRNGTGSICRGELSSAKANSDSLVRAFASAVSLRNWSPWVTSDAIRSLASNSDCFCNFIMIAVDTPTTTAAIAATPRNETITTFQASRSRPNIRLTFLETVVFSICAASIVAILATVVWVWIGYWRDRGIL
jgi:hypothetical protein